MDIKRESELVRPFALVITAFILIGFAILLHSMITNMNTLQENKIERFKIQTIIEKSKVFINIGGDEVVDTKRAVEIGIISEDYLKNSWGGRTSVDLSVAGGLIVSQSQVPLGDVCVQSINSLRNMNWDSYRIIKDGKESDFHTFKDHHKKLIHNCKGDSDEKVTIQFNKTSFL